MVSRKQGLAALGNYATCDIIVLSCTAVTLIFVLSLGNDGILSLSHDIISYKETEANFSNFFYVRARYLAHRAQN